jgi:membrane associated rhomboid family serine protease
MIIFQRRVSNLLAGWIALVLVLSIAVGVDFGRGGDLYERLTLVPSDVWREPWRLATWAFVEVGPHALFFGCIAIYVFGGDLLEAWGERRFARVVLGGVLAIGVATALVAPVIGAAHHGYLGAAALGDALLITWGLTFPTRQVRMWLVLSIDGQTLAIGMTLFTLLCVVFWGLAAMLPWLVATVLAIAYTDGKRARLRTVRGSKPPPRGPYAVN